ncbi:MAG: TraB/GumN family protein, partial [Candidatus Caenarcaniphilales bacterium]|nr:TraB/GumN family protein [Candidatus Caenarcaniphilales bacterium]
MNKLIKLLILALILLSPTADATTLKNKVKTKTKTETSIQSRRILASDNTKSPIWKISKNNKTAYILGSVHVLRKEDYPLNKKFDEIYSLSQTLVFEADLNGDEQPFSAPLFLQLGIYQNGEQINSELSKESYEQLLKVLKEINLPENVCNSMKPWFCSLYLSIFEYKKLGFDENLGIEKYFLEKLKKDKKKVLSLETVDFQVKLLANTNKDVQEQILVSGFKDLLNLKEFSFDIVHSWKTGDKERLDRLLNESLKSYPQLLD